MNKKMKLCNDLVHFCNKVSQPLEEDKENMVEEVRISKEKLLDCKLKLHKVIILLLKEGTHFQFRDYCLGL